MKAGVRLGASAWLAGLVLGVSGNTGAVTSTCQATDLADVVAGEDLWQHCYSVSGSFAAFDAFNILFSPSLYKNLENPPPTVNADSVLLGLGRVTPGARQARFTRS